MMIVAQLYAQLQYSIVGTYKGKSAQGMAIWEDRAYLFNDGGHCRVLDLKLGVVQYEFDLASSDEKPHINNACFGLEFVEGSDVPVIYISETDKPHRCFVESIRGNNIVLKQTIEAQENGKFYPNHDWIVDKEKGFLYGINRRWNDYIDQQGNVKNIITKYRLPKLEEGKNVTLTENDIIERFEVVFQNGMQGAKIRKNMLYITSGLHEMEREKKESQRAIIVVDLKNKRIAKKIDLTMVTTNEPEDIDFYKKKCLLYCGQNGGIYEIQTK